MNVNHERDHNEFVGLAGAVFYWLLGAVVPVSGWLPGFGYSQKALPLQSTMLGGQVQNSDPA